MHFGDVPSRQIQQIRMDSIHKRRASLSARRGGTLRLTASSRLSERKLSSRAFAAGQGARCGLSVLSAGSLVVVELEQKPRPRSARRQALKPSTSCSSSRKLPLNPASRVTSTAFAS